MGAAPLAAARVRRSRQFCRSAAPAALLCCVLVLASPVAASAQTVQYVYDAAGRLVGVIAPNGESAVYTYDAVGNLLSITRHPATAVNIIHFSPSSGPIGTTVTISGTGFSATPSQNTVTFNGTTAVVTAASTTQLVTTVPTGATTGVIGLTTPSGSATSSSPFTVTTSSPPTIISFTPTIGSPGTSVTITGTNFDLTLPNKVRFNTGLASVNNGSDTVLTAVVPVVGTSGHIQVSTIYGTAISVDDFFVPPSPYTAADVLVTGRIAVSGNMNVALTTANKIGLIVFDGAAGQRVSFIGNVTSGSFGCSWWLQIIRPGGSLLAQTSPGCFNPAFLEPVTLPVTGTYTIVIDPSDGSTGTAAVIAHDVVDVTDPITPNGSAVVAALTTPGQNARLPFSGTAGQLISAVGNVTSGSLGCYWYLQILKPDGNLLGETWSCGGSQTFLEPLTLPVSGTYTLVVNPAYASTGTASINLYEVADITDPITANGSTVVASLNAAGQNARLPFSGTAGRRISAVAIVTSGNFGCYWYLQILKPDGNLLGQTWSCGGGQTFLEPLTLPVSGTYTLVVNPAGSSTGSASINLYDVVDVTDSLSPGSPLNISLTAPGQNARLPFSGTANQQVSVSASVTSGSFGCYWYLQILKPNGALLSETWSCGGLSLGVPWSGSVTLPTTGTYTVVVNPAYLNTGTATVSLSLTDPTGEALTTEGGATFAAPIGRVNSVSRIVTSIVQANVRGGRARK